MIIETRKIRRYTSLQLRTALFKMQAKTEGDETYGTNPTPDGMWDGTETNTSDGTNNESYAAISNIRSLISDPRATI